MCALEHPEHPLDMSLDRARGTAGAVSAVLNYLWLLFIAGAVVEHGDG